MRLGKLSIQSSLSVLGNAHACPKTDIAYVVELLCMFTFRPSNEHMHGKYNTLKSQIFIYKIISSNSTNRALHIHHHTSYSTKYNIKATE